MIPTRFRWAACQVEILSKLHCVADIRDGLQNLPKTLDATYERVLSNMPEEHRSTAKKALLLLSNSDFNFSDVLTLREAVAVDIENQTYDPADSSLLSVDVLANICTCLVRITEGSGGRIEVRLAHYTV